MTRAQVFDAEKLLGITENSKDTGRPGGATSGFSWGRGHPRKQVKRVPTLSAELRCVSRVPGILKGPVNASLARQEQEVLFFGPVPRSAAVSGASVPPERGFAMRGPK
jgi:hypothetical protein